MNSEAVHLVTGKEKQDGGRLDMLTTECHRHSYQEQKCVGPQPEIEGGGD